MHEILIIGAGASGLMAASQLAGTHHVTIAEARDHVGGRIHTIHSGFRFPVEAGAEFMHGRQPLTESLIRNSRSEVSLLTGKRYQIWNGEREHGDIFDADWERLTKALQGMRTDTDMASFLKTHFNTTADRTLREKVRSFVEGFDAADMERVSALSLREEWSQGDDEHQYHIVGGYGRLMQYLSEKATSRGAHLSLSTEVKEIRWRKGRVEAITTSGATLEGEKVIITVPLGVLKDDAIRFTPHLTGHADAFHKMGFGGVIKFFVEFKSPFWEDKIASPLKELAFIFSDAEVPTWWTHRPQSETMLTGWLGGPAAMKLPDNQEFLVEKAVRSLAYILACTGEDITSEAQRWHVENWCVDRLTRGAYAYPTVHTRQALEHIAKPVNDTIYFAGEGMYQGSAIGTVEAALVSGLHVANQIYPTFNREENFTL